MGLIDAEARQLLVGSIQVSTTDNSKTIDVLAEILDNPDGWDAYGYFTDPDGQIPFNRSFVNLYGGSNSLIGPNHTATESQDSNGNPGGVYRPHMYETSDFYDEGQGKMDLDFLDEDDATY
jgi:hypothetical protein